MAAWEERIHHVAAIELTNRQKIQRCYEQPDPSGEGNRMKIHVDHCRIHAEHQMREAEEEQRVSELETTGGFIERGDVGKP